MTKKNELAVRQQHNTSIARPRSFYEQVVVPSIDILETDTEYRVFLDIPGSDKHTIGVNLEDNTIRIRASAGDYHNSGAKMMLHELRHTVYERNFYIGEGVDRNSIEAEYNDGVLFIRLKKSDSFIPKHITIK